MWELALVSTLLIAFGVGSNDSSNALGICIGAGVIPLKRALFLFGILVFLGIFLKGGKVLSTVGKELVKTDTNTTILAMFVAGFLVISSNIKKLPLSTHQVIIGSLIGGALASSIKINFKKLEFIVISWVISPFIALCITFVLGLLLEKILRRLSFIQVEKLLRNFLLLSAALLSFNTGANELATVLGPVCYLIPKKYHIGIFALGSLTVFLGSYLLSYKVIETIGKGITALDPFSSFAAQLGAGLCVYLFTIFGMPVSTTYCIVGAVVGIGLTKGLSTVSFSLVKRILFNFFLAPFLSFSLTYFLTLFVNLF
jgi:PiT family inorganic phosphate transporter